MSGKGVRDVRGGGGGRGVSGKGVKVGRRGVGV